MEGICSKKTLVKHKEKKTCHHGPTNTYQVQTPLGEMTIVSCPKGLHSLSQAARTDDTFKPDKWCQVEFISQLYSDNGYTYTPALHCIQWLKNYFLKQENDTRPSICPSISRKDTFTGKVWQTLTENVPFGETISYKGLSLAAGRDGAFRAVGQAMASNPVPLIIPCHRVIRSDGAFGNYAKGELNSVKEWLLQFERELFNLNSRLPYHGVHKHCILSFIQVSKEISVFTILTIL
ncbi:hypothetical protein C0Q70_00977 [Pomacea canaliculata]|uniref:Methylated-DNA--protein-cysteine methyltransferase n=2 Tax=Pomacea canaliculata TaxID=400727 RepID=A0A2T7PY63_POMCA|nr:hypothetical protein C0Q70_00977 [Pomacea canaliculata]